MNDPSPVIEHLVHDADFDGMFGLLFFFFQAEDGIRDRTVTGVQTCALPIWIGGELMDFRAVGGTIRMLVYRINFANPAADRYSRLALWQVHKTREELDAAFK